MIEGISHITFIVRDLDRMETILTAVLGARKVYDSGETTFSLSPERFFMVGTGETPVWIAIMQGEPTARRSYDHIAFKTDATGLDAAEREIERLGLTVRDGRARVEGEGASVYFYDDDGHLFELHTGTLEERLRRYARSTKAD